MRTGSGLFLLGVLTPVQFEHLPPLWPAVLLGMCMAGCAWRWRGLRTGLWFCLGLLWSLLYATMLLQQQLDPALERRTLTAHGHVVSLPEYHPRHIQFDLGIDRLMDSDQAVHPAPARVRLNWYCPCPELRAGQALVIEVRMKRPHGYLNPHGFDYEAWLFSQRIRATGYVRRNVTDEAAVRPEHSLHAIRQLVRDRLLARTEASGSGALMLALAIGDQSAIHRDQWRVLAATGTGHLLSISGLHIGLVAALAFFLMRWAWAFSPALSSHCPSPRVAGVAALLAAAVYSLLAGFTIPVQRSLVMVGVFTIPAILDRRVPVGDSYAAALIAVLLLDPLAVLSVGFWLSFGAVLVILCVPDVIVHAGRGQYRITRWLRIQIYIFAGLLLMSVCWFNQITFAGLLANAVAIPWVSLVSVPLILVAMMVLFIDTGAGTVLLYYGLISLDALWPVLEELGRVDSLVIPVATPSTGIFITALAGTLWLFLPPGIPARWAGLFAFLPLFLDTPELPDRKEFDLTVLDVGQGLSIVVRTRGHVLVYDTGPGFPGGFNTGWAVVLPYLKGEGINHIDRLIVSHGDNDHIGGLADVLAGIETGSILTSVDLPVQHHSVQRCKAGQAWQWDGIVFTMLSPANDSLSGNDASCVLRVDNGSDAVLLAGDIERRAEEGIVARHAGSLQSTILIAPHHGSLTSSTPAFIRAVDPEQVIFSTGYLNRYSLPKQDIMKRYEDAGAGMKNTALDGAIRLRFDARGVTLTTERETSSRFWNFRQ